MSSPPSFAARYWGVLNRLRETAIVSYATVRTVHGPRNQRPLNIIIAVLIALGLAWIVGLGILTMTGESTVTGEGAASGAWAVSALVVCILALPGIAFVGFGTRAAFGLRARRREASLYDARAAERTAWLRLFEGLAQDGSGTVTSDGISAAMRFLVEHHPECAPTVLLHHQAGNDEDRITLVARQEELPLLVQLIDNSEHGTRVRPPALAVLVASPIDPAIVALTDESAGADAPFRTAGTKRLEDTAAHKALSDRGFVVGWTSAGAWAIHPGPLGLLDREALTAIVVGVVDLCKGAAAENAVVTTPSAPSVEIDESDYEKVAEAFLCALRDRDALAALALAHPMLFPRAPREPTSRDLDRPIDDARARPVRWEPASLTSAGDVRRGVKADFADRPSEEAHVHLSRVGDRWTIEGYAVGSEQVIGLPFIEPSS